MTLLSAQDKVDVFILQFIEIQTKHMLEHTKPKTRRANQLHRMLEHTSAVDETYAGYLSDEDLNRANELYNEFSIFMGRVIDEQRI